MGTETNKQNRKISFSGCKLDLIESNYGMAVDIIKLI
jgi:hypothetical protein